MRGFPAAIVRWTRALILGLASLAVPLALNIAAGAPASADVIHWSPPANEKGWCSPTAGAGAYDCYASPHDACYRSYQYFGLSWYSGDVYQGETPSATGGWRSWDCHWTRPMGGPGLGSILFYCVYPANELPPGRCPLNQDDLSSFAGEGCPTCGPPGVPQHQTTPHPVQILSGAKFLDQMDFASADGELNYWLARTQVVGGSTLLDLSFDRNADGQVTTVTDNASTGRGASFTYTDASRLQTAIGPWGQWNYTYDGAGNFSEQDTSVGRLAVS